MQVHVPFLGLSGKKPVEQEIYKSYLREKRKMGFNNKHTLTLKKNTQTKQGC